MKVYVLSRLNSYTGSFETIGVFSIKFLAHNTASTIFTNEHEYQIEEMTLDELVDEM